MTEESAPLPVGEELDLAVARKLGYRTQQLDFRGDRGKQWIISGQRCSIRLPAFSMWSGFSTLYAILAERGWRLSIMDQGAAVGYQAIWFHEATSDYGVEMCSTIPHAAAAAVLRMMTEAGDVDS